VGIGTDLTPREVYNGDYAKGERRGKEDSPKARKKRRLK